MKTEVSLPDPVFAAVEQAAAKLGISPDEIYTRALTDWLVRQDEPKRGWKHLSDDEVTARLNEIYSREPSHLDPFIAQVQANAIGVEEW